MGNKKALAPTEKGRELQICFAPVIPPILSFIFGEVVVILATHTLYSPVVRMERPLISGLFATWKPSTCPTCCSICNKSLQLSSVSRSRGGSETIRPYRTLTKSSVRCRVSRSYSVRSTRVSNDNSVVVYKNNSSFTRCQIMCIYYTYATIHT